MAEPVAKVSNAKESADRRKKLFVERYLVNGNNATDAALHAGFSPRTAKSQAHRLLQLGTVKTLIESRVQRVMLDAELTTERWAQEMACIAHFDPGELYDSMGNLIPIHQLPEHVRRAIASVKTNLKGEVSVTMVDKNAALANVGKHLGVFESDNRQKSEGIKVLVQLMG